MDVLGKLKILLVEDDGELREALSESLKLQGYEVVGLENGRLAFQNLLAGQKYDLIISDIRMPGGDGMELLSNIREKFSEPPPLFLMTGFTDVIFTEALQAGVHTIIPKPFKTSALMEAIEKLLGSAKKGRASTPL